MNDITITDLRSIKNYFPKKSVENYINKILLKKFNSKIQYCQCSLFFESQDKQKNKYFFRDKLGIHKFFYCYRKKQEILIANNLYILVKNGCRIENIKSFKPGVLYHLNKDNVIEAISYSNFLEKNSNFHDLLISLKFLSF